MIKNLYVLLQVISCTFAASAKDYPASLFGIDASGTVLNTRSIQFGIDYISESGGGRLVFPTGKYLTGTLYIKSDVTIEIEEGAVLLGSVNPFDYDRQNIPFDNNKATSTALIFSVNEKNIGITGKGVINGQGKELAANISDMVKKGFIKDASVSRPGEENRPMIIHFYKCNGVTISGITFKNSACWVECYNQCKNITIESITVDSKAFWNNDGIDLVDCENGTVRHSHFDCNDDGICLKSLDAGLLNHHIRIENNTITSGASGIKFGTASHGGFSDIHIISNTVFDTYRSVLALEAVDGAVIENIEVDSLRGTNVGNAIFLRLGARSGDRKSTLNNVSIQQVSVVIRQEKTPVMVAPAIIIAGLPDQFISGIRFKNITVTVPGSVIENAARISDQAVHAVPEKPGDYPEFSMFGDLPAWGVYIRHARDIQFSNLSLSTIKSEVRNAVVLDDVHQGTFRKISVDEPKHKKKIYSYHSSGISFK